MGIKGENYECLPSFYQLLFCRCFCWTNCYNTAEDSNTQTQSTAEDSNTQTQSTAEDSNTQTQSTTTQHLNHWTNKNKTRNF